MIRSGMKWTENFKHVFTEDFKNSKDEVEKCCYDVFNKNNFDATITSCSVVEFTKLGDEVLAEIKLQFDGLSNSISSEDVMKMFAEQTKMKNGSYMMGHYDVNVHSSYFLIAENEIKDDSRELPDWAWLVVMGSIVSVCIIAMFGVTISIHRYKHNSETKKRVLNAKTLNVLRGQKAFEMMERGKISVFFSFNHLNI